MQSKGKDDNTVEWNYGDIVWGKYEKSKVWPGIIFNPKDGGYEPSEKNGYYWLWWYGDKTVNEIHKNKIYLFAENFNEMFKTHMRKQAKKWRIGVIDAIRDYGLPLSKNWKDNQLISWASNGFSTPSDFKRAYVIPDHIMEDLTEKKQVNEEDNFYTLIKKSAEPDIRNMLWTPKLQQSKRICLGCYELQASEDHPIFEAHFCKYCKDRYKKTIHIIGDDGVMYHCTVCGHVGKKTTVCSEINCTRVFCEICLTDLATPELQKLISKQKEWSCLVCKPDKNQSTLLKIRPDWLKNINALYDNRTPVVSIPKLLNVKKKIKVLSICSPVAAGPHLLKKLNVEIEHCYTCEIDKTLLNLVEINFRTENITNLGEVKILSEDSLKKILPIDLLIGGLPCNSTTLSEKSFNYSSELFFEFYRILMILRRYNDFFWLFEDVVSISDNHQEAVTMINRYLQSEAIAVNSPWLPIQHRPRLCWSNFLSIEDTIIEQNDSELHKYFIRVNENDGKVSNFNQRW